VELALACDSVRRAPLPATTTHTAPRHTASITARNTAQNAAQQPTAVLLGLVAATTVSFARIDANAGKLMAPYLAFTVRASL
jgi:hypothetical protein